MTVVLAPGCGAGVEHAFRELDAPEGTISIAWAVESSKGLRVWAQSAGEPLVLPGPEARVFARFYPVTLEALGVPEGELPPRQQETEFGTLPPSPLEDGTRLFDSDEDSEWSYGVSEALRTFVSPALPVNEDGCFDFEVEAVFAYGAGEPVEKLLPWDGGDVLGLARGSEELSLLHHDGREWTSTRRPRREVLPELEDADVVDYRLDEAGRPHVLSVQGAGTTSVSVPSLWIAEGGRSPFVRLDRLSDAMAEVVVRQSPHPFRVHVGADQAVLMAGTETIAYSKTSSTPRPLWTEAATAPAGPEAYPALTHHAGAWFSVGDGGVREWGPSGESRSVPGFPSELTFARLISTRHGLVLATNRDGTATSVALYLRDEAGAWTRVAERSTQEPLEASAHRGGLAIATDYGGLLYWSPREGFCEDERLTTSAIPVARFMVSLPSGRLALVGRAHLQSDARVAVLRSRPRLPR